MATNAVLSVIPEAQLGTKGLVITVKTKREAKGRHSRPPDDRKGIAGVVRKERKE